MWSELLGAVDWSSDGNVILVVVGRASRVVVIVLLVTLVTAYGHAGDWLCMVISVTGYLRAIEIAGVGVS